MTVFIGTTRLAILIFTIGILLPACSQHVLFNENTGEAHWLDGRWPHEKSDLPPHDKAVFGRLGNGFRYVLQKNSRPAGRVEVHLDVQAGSLMENDDELGLAHYLEHMAFNGSRHFKPGELIPFFQKNGMAFGRDANAHTSYLETVYKLSLASTDKKNLEQGLLVMRDIADGMSILEEEVEKERGVIMSEKAARDSEGFRARLRRQSALFGGTRFDSTPIGSEEVILSTDAKTIRGFYDAWYRPELMILVVVGDIEPSEVEGSIKKMFANLKAHGKPRVLQNWGNVHVSGLMTYYDSYKSESTNVMIHAIKPRVWQDDSWQRQEQQIRQSMANHIVSQRLATLKSEGSAPFLRAFSMPKDAYGLFPSVSLVANCEGDKWEQTLTVLQDELHRAEKFGFLTNEVDMVRKEYLRYFELLAKREADMPSDEFAELMITCFNDNSVYMSMTQTHEIIVEMMRKVTAENLHEAFVAMWNTGNRIVSITGNATIKGDADLVLANRWERGEDRAVAPMTAIAELNYPYVEEPDSTGRHGAVTVSRLPGSELEIHETSFENGLRLRMLPTPYQQGQVSFSLLVKGGTDQVPDGEYDQFLVASQINSASGIGRLQQNEQRRLFGMKGIQVGMSLGREVLRLDGSGQTSDAEAILRAMWTEYRDPVVADKDRKVVLERLALADAGRTKDVPSLMRAKAPQFFRGNSLAIRPLTAKRAEAVSMDQVRNALARIVTPGEAVLVVVGDFIPESVSAGVSRFFGAPGIEWKKSNAVKSYNRGPVFPHHEAVEKSCVADASLNQAALWVGFPQSLGNVSDRRQLTIRRMLTTVIRDRLRVKIREDMGATYSPSMNYISDDSNGYGLYLVRINTQPGKLKRLRSAVDAAIQEIASSGVTQEELDRLKRPMLTGWKRNREVNRRYLGLMAAEIAKGLPYLEWDAQLPTLIASVTVEDLNKAARKALGPENKAVFIGSENSAKVGNQGGACARID